MSSRRKSKLKVSYGREAAPTDVNISAVYVDNIEETVSFVKQVGQSVEMIKIPMEIAQSEKIIDFNRLAIYIENRENRGNRHSLL